MLNPERRFKLDWTGVNAATDSDDTAADLANFIRPDSLTFPELSYFPPPPPPTPRTSTFPNLRTPTPSTITQPVRRKEMTLPTPDPSQSDSHKSEESSEYSQEGQISALDSSCWESESDTIFPPNRLIPYYPLHYVRHPDYAYQTELRFRDEEYRTCWNRPAVDLTNRLMPRNANDPRAVGHREIEFAGIYARLFLDPGRTKGLTPFHRGTVIDFCDINTPHLKYIVECCQRDSDGVAYLKVVCHTEDQQVIPAFDETRPTLILAIPSRLNKDPYYNDILAPFPHMSNTLTPAVQLPSLSFQTEYIEQPRQTDFRDRLLHFTNFLCPCF